MRRKDITIVEAGKFYDGVATLEQKPSYNLQFQSEGFIDLLTIETCHQYKTYTKEKILKRKYLDVEYSPTPIEKEKVACPMFISSYEKDKGRHSFGIIEFKRDQYKLKFVLECDGTKISDKGIALCQSKIGTTQRISFDSNTKFVTSERCKDAIKPLDNSFDVKIKKDLCVFTFKNNNEFARLTTFGFESVLVY
jgi:hypothetical protein